jgi:hypothetical protein
VTHKVYTGTAGRSRWAGGPRAHISIFGYDRKTQITGRRYDIFSHWVAARFREESHAMRWMVEPGLQHDHVG